jgi:hypothetical protein
MVINIHWQNMHVRNIHTPKMLHENIKTATQHFKQHVNYFHYLPSAPPTPFYISLLLTLSIFFL